MIKDAQTYQQADKDFSARHEAKQSLEAYVSSVESTSASSLLEPPSVAETPLQAPCPGAPSLAPPSSSFDSPSLSMLREHHMSYRNRVLTKNSALAALLVPPTSLLPSFAHLSPPAPPRQSCLCRALVTTPHSHQPGNLGQVEEAAQGRCRVGACQGARAPRDRGLVG